MTVLPIHAGVGCGKAGVVGGGEGGVGQARSGSSRGGKMQMTMTRSYKSMNDLQLFKRSREVTAIN